MPNKTPFLIATVASIVFSIPSMSATWRVLESHKFQDWDATHNEYTSQNGQFCAAETENANGDVFRINFFKDGSVHFMEIFGSNWNFFEGKVNFTLDFDGGYSAELKGKSWGDAYTYDFVDQDKTFGMFGLMSQSKTVNVLNSNNGVIATFSLLGSDPALRKMMECFRGNE